MKSKMCDPLGDPRSTEWIQLPVNIPKLASHFSSFEAPRYSLRHDCRILIICHCFEIGKLLNSIII